MAESACFIKSYIYFQFRLCYHRDKESPIVRNTRSKLARTDPAFDTEEVWFSILSGLGPLTDGDPKRPNIESAYGQYDSENTLYAEIDSKDIEMCKTLRENLFDFCGELTTIVYRPAGSKVRLFVFSKTIRA